MRGLLILLKSIVLKQKNLPCFSAFVVSAVMFLVLHLFDPMSTMWSLFFYFTISSFSELQSSDNHQEFINKELESNSKCWSGSPMESAFVVTSRKCTLIQRDQLSKITKLLISSWKFLELADEITGIGATSMGNEIAELGECLFEAIKAGLKNLHLVCCSKVLSMLTAMLFEESAFTLLKVLLNLSDEARNDVQLVFDDSRKDESFGGNLMNFATKVSCFNLSC